MFDTRSPSRSRRVPRSVRAAQVLLLIPLGLLQLVAAVTFTVVLRPTTVGDLSVAAWAIIMSSACAVVALRLGRGGPGTYRVAIGLLVAQAAFSAVKLLVYGEPESLVFAGLTITTAVLLLLPTGRHYLEARPDVAQMATGAPSHLEDAPVG